MSVLDVFASDAFSVRTLTQAINKLPYKPARIGQMGLFGTQGIATTTAMVEEKEGLLALLPTKLRGEPGSTGKGPKRKVRALAVPHIPHTDTIMADDVQNVRAFGSDSQLESIVTVVNDRLTLMRQNHEATEEYHRMGAIHGVVLDADGASVVLDLHQVFNTTPTTKDFPFTTSDTDVRGLCLDVLELVETALGAGTYDHVHALCGVNWFKALIAHGQVQRAWERFQDGAKLRDDPRAGFEFGDIIFERYRGRVSGVDFINANQARFFPVGVPNLFMTYYAPANYVETVNTIGLPVYSKQVRLKYDKGIEIETQSNPLCLCHRPSVLIKGTMS